MATDGLSIYATVREFGVLCDARIDRISQPDKDMLLLHLHGTECGRRKLLININNENGRIQFTERSFENPDKAPSFCMILRKYLTGARIIDAEQQDLDRIICFFITGKDDLHDDISLKLVVELMGRHGNVFLLDSENMILDCMRHFGPSDDSLRLCLPNCRYEKPPAQRKPSPFALSADALNVLSKGTSPALWLGNEAQGISRLCAQQICPNDCPPERIGTECYEVFRQLSEGRFVPAVIPDKGVLPFLPRNAECQIFSTMSDAQEAFYRLRDELTILSGRKTVLASTLTRTIKKLTKKLELFVSEVTDDARIEKDRRYGELLLANLASIHTVQHEAVVTDYYADPPEEIRIPLDARYSVKQNAQRYFKNYRKAKTASAYAGSQISSLQEEIEYLEGLQMSLESASDVSEIMEIRDEMILQGYLKAEYQQKKRKQQQEPSRPIIYRAPDGTVIKAGKNNLQNDRLLKTERAEYIWMHAQKMPSSHVYIESDDPSRETILLAAEITALHSRASASSHVPVDYTRKRDVKKPTGARPGFVNYFNQHTLYVTPDAEKLNQYRIE